MIDNKMVDESINNDVFVTSDTHFNHKNIMKYCNRSFKDVQEMNDILVKNWNKTVKQNDKVYFLGDMAFRNKKQNIDYWLSQLNGTVYFIKGNHDRDSKITLANIIKEGYKINHNGYEFLLMHYPYSKPSNWNGWIIHGHLHNHDLVNYPYINKKQKTINISTELTNYTPVNLNDIISKISKD